MGWSVKRSVPYFNPDNCIAFDDKETIQHLFSLQSLKATTFVPIVLALEMRKDQFTAGDIANILDAIETYIFRNATIAGKPRMQPRSSSPPLQMTFTNKISSLKKKLQILSEVK